MSTDVERQAFKAYNPLGYAQMDGWAVWQAACAWQRSQQVQADAGAVAGHFVKRSIFGPWIEVDPVKESGTPFYTHPSPAGESDKP